jgi:hypothetical protein
MIGATRAIDYLSQNSACNLQPATINLQPAIEKVYSILLLSILFYFILFYLATLFCREFLNIQPRPLGCQPGPHIKRIRIP